MVVVVEDEVEVEVEVVVVVSDGPIALHPAIIPARRITNINPANR